MKYLHEDKEKFKKALLDAQDETGQPLNVIEKDYYITMILKQIQERVPWSVFKGGTSLSKAHHVIDRFSEDIDIAFNRGMSRSQRRNMKHNIMEGTSKELSLPIKNIDKVQSGRNYTKYVFPYESVCESSDDPMLKPEVKVEVVYHTVSFPSDPLPISNYIAEGLKEKEPELIKEYGLEPFGMLVQGLDRTLADKIFALCDYREQGKDYRTSRHLYDVYVLSQKVDYTSDGFKHLVDDVRKARKKLDDCPSAHDGMSVPAMMQKAIESDFYRSDYEINTEGLISPKSFVPYETVCERALQIARSGAFGMAVPPYGGGSGQPPRPKDDEPAEDGKSNSDDGLLIHKAAEDALLFRDDDKADSEPAAGNGAPDESGTAGACDMADDFDLEM